MADWHLTTLFRALSARGWSVETSVEGDPFVWKLDRSSTLHLEFGRFDGAGEDLPFEETYGCWVADAREVGLYSYRKRSPNWTPQLEEFLARLDAL